MNTHSLIPRSFIDDLLARCDLIEIIDSRVPLKKAGHQYTACCPFHNEKTPSFNVSSAKQVYYCFGCGASGNAISFLIAYERLDFPTAIEVLAAHLGLEVPRTNAPARPKVQKDLYTLLDTAAKYYQKQLAQNTAAIDYLKQRGMTGETAKHFRIGYAPSGWDHLLKHIGQNSSDSLLSAGLLSENDQKRRYDRFRHRIIFPIRDQRGRIIGFGGRIINPDDNPKYLNSPETAVFQKGKELYGLYEAQQAHRHLAKILVVEGYMDVVMLAQHGIRYAVATMGTATTPAHIHRLMKLTTEIIFCFDGDNAGQTAAWRALECALPLLADSVQIRFLLLPQDEDPDSLVCKEGTDGFTNRINTSASLADFFFQQLSAQVDLTQIHGRAQLADLALPLIQQIPEGIFQRLMLERLANLVRLDISHIKKQTHYTVMRQQETPVLSLMRLTVLLLLQNPSLINSIKNPHDFHAFTLRGGTLLKDLLIILSENPQLTTGALLEHFRSRPEYEQLCKLAYQEHHVPAQGITAEFQALLQRLLQLDKQQKIEQLLLKAQQNILSDEEKKILQKLISENKK